MRRCVAFIDESYSQDEYFIASLVVPEASLRFVETEVDLLLSSLRSLLDPCPEELHAHELLTGRGRWEPISRNTRLKLSIVRKTLDVVARIPGARIFVEGVDVRRLRARYRYPENPHATAFRHIVEHIDVWASTESMRIEIVADDIASREAHQRELRHYKEVGTGGFYPRTIVNVHEPIVFLDSRESPGLQLSDTLVYLFRRRHYLMRIDGTSRGVRTVNSLLATVDGAVEHTRFWSP
jgi:hypothetical protein